MSKPPSSLKRKKPDDNVSPGTLLAEALSKSVDTCIHCNINVVLIRGRTARLYNVTFAILGSTLPARD